MNLINATENLTPLLDRNRIKVKYTNQSQDNHSLSYQSYLDMIQFEAVYGSFNFLQSSNKQVAISRKFWSKPALGLVNRSQMKGHLYCFGSIENKYDLHIAFSPRDNRICECKLTQKELHVSTTISTYIADACNVFLNETGGNQVGYYSALGSNLYLSEPSRVFYVQTRDMKASFMPAFTGHDFFETHKAHWVITCLGQNDYLDSPKDICKELKASFEIENISSMRFSVAIGVSAEDLTTHNPLSVVLPKKAFEAIYDEPCTHFTKSFNDSFCNFQGPNIPESILDEITQRLNDKQINLVWSGEKINFYNGKFILRETKVFKRF